jgi:hypothetical protein
MLPLTVYTHSLPLTSEAALEIYHSSVDAIVGGCFLSFVQIPVEERIGEWRFAGSSDSLRDAMRNVTTFCLAIGMFEPDRDGFIELLEFLADHESLATDQDWETGLDAEFDAFDYRLVLAGEGDAPYDDLGLCIIEVESLEAVGFVGRPPETSIPDEWQ